MKIPTKYGTALLIPSKIYLKAKSIARDKDDHIFSDKKNNY